MIVYLAGPINGCSDSEAMDWREIATRDLKHETLDPMRRDYRGREMEPGIAAEIVKDDIEDIKASDIMLVFHPKPSTGTDMEIRLAKAELGKMVVAVVPTGAPISPWLVFHCTKLFNTLDEAICWINSEAISYRFSTLYGAQ